MEFADTAKSITRSNEALCALLGMADASGMLDAACLTKIKLVIIEVHKVIQKYARAGRSERTRYIALTSTALEVAEGWLAKAQFDADLMEE